MLTYNVVELTDFKFESYLKADIHINVFQEQCDMTNRVDSVFFTLVELP